VVEPSQEMRNAETDVLSGHVEKARPLWDDDLGSRSGEQLAHGDARFEANG